MRLLSFLLVGLVAWSCHAAEPIRVGVSGPFTGGSSPMGISMRDGIRVAVAELNAAGGVLGRPIQLVERDDEASNDRGALVVQELINQHKVVAGLGIVNTGVALASQRFYQQARIPIITSVATGSLVTKQFLPPQYPDNFVFRVSASDSLQAEMIVEDAVDRRGLRKVAILHDTTNYGQLGRGDVERALEQRGLKPASVERFNLRDVDMTPQLRRAKEAGAQVLITYGIGVELAHIANQRARIDWNVPMVGSWTLSMPNFIDNAGPNAEGSRMPQTFVLAGASPRRQAFLEAYRRLHGIERIPVPPAAAQGYDSALLLAAAIRQARSTDGDRIRDALEHLKEKVDGAVMAYDRPFTPSDHEAVKNTRMIAMGEVRGGRVELAELPLRR